MEKTTNIEKQVVQQVFKNKEFADAVAQAIGENIVKAVRKIDDWNLEYEIKNVMQEVIFSDEFREEVKGYAKSYIEENKDDIKRLVKDKMASTLTAGITASAEKISELLLKRITDVKSIY